MRHIGESSSHSVQIIETCKRGSNASVFLADRLFEHFTFFVVKRCQIQSSVI